MNVGTENELAYTCPTEIWVVLPWVELTSELLPELYLTDEILLQVTLQDTLCGAGHISWSRFFCTPQSKWKEKHQYVELISDRIWEKTLIFTALSRKSLTRSRESKSQQ